MSWIILVIAGLLEVVWAVGLKYTHGFSRLTPSVITVTAMIVSMALLAWAMKSLPVGTAYAVWTGIGAVGAAITGIVLLGESANPMRLASLALIVLGDYWSETQHSLTTGLLYPNKLTDIKPFPGRDCQHLLFHFVRNGWRAGEYPQVVAVRAANQRMAVFPIECNNVITAIERTKE